MSLDTRTLAFTGLFAALTALATMLITLPVPATQGYINLGDTMVMLSGFLLGSIAGGIAGGVGSALADVFLGYAHWAPFTLVIKGLEGAVAGISKGRPLKVSVPVLILAGIIMFSGYFIVEVFMYGLGAALGELPGNIFQATSGVIFTLIIGPILRRLAPNVF